jgi:hypothetical protein
MKRTLCGALAIAALCAMMIRPQVLAQSAVRAGQAARAAQAPSASTPRTWYSVNIVTIKRGAGPEWVELQKTQTIPMQQKGGVKMRETWQSGAPFGEGSTYAIVTQIDKFADYDQPPLAQRMMSGDALRAFQEKNNRLVERNHAFAIQDRAELSIVPAASAQIKGAILNDVTVVGGHAEQYESYIKNDLLPVLKKGNVLGYLVSRTIFGGNGNEYHTLQLIDSFGAIDKGPIPLLVLGAAGAQALTAKATPHIASINRQLMRYVPDLSFRGRSSS